MPFGDISKKEIKMGSKKIVLISIIQYHTACPIYEHFPSAYIGATMVFIKDF